MSKKRIFILVFLSAIILPALLYQLFSYKTSREYKDATLPFYAQDKTTGEILHFESPKKIAQNLLAGEEFFKGYIKVSALNHDTAEITMRDDITGDDSMIAIEYYVIAERTQSGWKVSQYKIHWKCRGLYWPKFWTTSGCL